MSVRTSLLRIVRDMNPHLRELVVLTLASAVLCGVALLYEQPAAAAVFLALTCTSALMALALRRFY
jgi:hypothetical protein